MRKMDLAAFFVVLLLSMGTSFACAQSAVDQTPSPKAPPKHVLTIQNSGTARQAQGAVANADHAMDGTPSENHANASSVSEENDLARKMGEAGRQLALRDSKATEGSGSPGSSYFTDSSISVPAPKSTGSKDHREGRAGTVWGAYSGYVAMAAFGMGFFGILFAAAGGYLFGSHLWHIEHPSS